MAPQYTTLRGVGINLDHLNRAGLSTPTSTWTWDDFTQSATKRLRRGRRG